MTVLDVTMPAVTVLGVMGPGVIMLGVMVVGVMVVGVMVVGVMVPAVMVLDISSHTCCFCQSVLTSSPHGVCIHLLSPTLSPASLPRVLHDADSHFVWSCTE